MQGRCTEASPRCTCLASEKFPLQYQYGTRVIPGWYQGDTRVIPGARLMLHLSPHCTTPAHSRWTVCELVNYRWAGMMVVEGDSEDFLWNRSHSTTIQVILHWADRWSPTLSTNFFRVFVRSAKGAVFSALPHKRTFYVLKNWPWQDSNLQSPDP